MAGSLLFHCLLLLPALLIPQSGSQPNPATQIHLLTILNEETFSADQQTFARALNAKNAELRNESKSLPLLEFHSVELAAKPRLVDHLQDLCAAAASSGHAWLAILNFAQKSSVFSSAMVGQQLALPVLGYVNTLEPEIFRDVSPDFYIGLNPTSVQAAHAVANFIKAKKWHLISSVISDGSTAARVFQTSLKAHLTDQVVHVVLDSSHEEEVHGKMKALRDTKSRVQIIFVEPPEARIILREAQKLNMMAAGWVWIITDRSYTTRDDWLEDYAEGSRAIKIQQPSLGEIVRAGLLAISSGARNRLTPHLIARLQDRTARQLNCRHDVTPSAPAGDVAAAMRNYTREMRSVLEGPDSPKERVTYEILGLGTKNSRHRWTRIGNITGAGLKPAIVLEGKKFATTLTESRSHLRVVTRISHPFTIEDVPFTDEGVCLVGVPCLHVATKEEDELREIFTSFERGILTSPAHSFTCCKGLAMDLLMALSKDVGFDFDTYLVADDRDGMEIGNGQWDGMMGDLRSGAAHIAFGSISVTQSRKAFFDFSSPFYSSKFSFLVATTKAKVKLSAFLEPFSWKLWIAIFAALHATAIAAAIFEWISPFGLNPRGRMRSQNFTLATALTTVYSLFFSHVMAFKAPKSWPNKVLINFWGSFCFIILASYTANHAAIYAGFSQQPNFDDIFDNEDLLKRNVTTIPGTSAEGFIRNINKDLHDHMVRKNFFNVVSVDDAVDRLKKGTLDAFIYDTVLLDYVRASDSGCTLKTAGASFGIQGYAVAFPKRFRLTSQISTAILKYTESGFLDDLTTKWFGGLPCSEGPERMEMLNPRALGLEDFAGVFVLLGVGGGVGLLILGLEHLVYRALPRLRQLPRTSIVHSRHVMFFSQKLYRFLNSVDLVSPNSSAKEFASSIKQGQFIGMFQKSVKKRAKEEALQQKRTRNADNFFETIHELTRNLREASSLEVLEEGPDADTIDGATPRNGDVNEPRPITPVQETSRANGPMPPTNLPLDAHKKGPAIKQLSRQDRIAESVENIYNFTRSFPDFQRPIAGILVNKGTSSSLKDSLAPKKKVWMAQSLQGGAGFRDMDSEDEINSPSSPICPSDIKLPASPLDEDPNPYTSLRDWDDVDIDDLSKQDLIKMWQSTECDLRQQLQRLAREKSSLERELLEKEKERKNALALTKPRRSTPTDL